MQTKWRTCDLLKVFERWVESPSSRGGGWVCCCCWFILRYYLVMQTQRFFSGITFLTYCSRPQVSDSEAVRSVGIWDSQPGQCGKTHRGNLWWWITCLSWKLLCCWGIEERSAGLRLAGWCLCWGRYCDCMQGCYQCELRRCSGPDQIYGLSSGWCAV